jgi:hypothetical protein
VDPRQDVTRGCENGIMKDFKICNPHQIHSLLFYPADQNTLIKDMSTYIIIKIYYYYYIRLMKFAGQNGQHVASMAGGNAYEILLRNLNESDHLGALILNSTFTK